MINRNERLQIFSRNIVVAAAICVLALSGYVFSICWRVSRAEQHLFGRSDLIPLRLHPRTYTDQPSQTSFGDGSFTFMRDGRPIVVYKQLTNGFHAYGSALASYEIGNEVTFYQTSANNYESSKISVEILLVSALLMDNSFVDWEHY